MHCPPAISLINALEKNGVEIVLCTTKSKVNLKEKFPNVATRIIDIDYSKKTNIFNKFFRMKKLKLSLWKNIEAEYVSNSVIWIISDTGIKHLGKKILNFRYVIQLMELSEKLYYYKKLKFLKMNEKKIGNGAELVVVPEYNRAHITKSWWKLNNLPFILENKPFSIDDEKDYSEITNSEYAKRVIDSLEGKKIVLYQGIMHRERQLDKYIEAISELGDDYAFVVMSDGENPYASIESNNYYYIPFVEPPYHLEITNKCYIGVLSYFPVETRYSILNALYCAPNKTFEYAKFSKPMISNDVPALNYLFSNYNCGIAFDNYEVKKIKESILEIETNYKEMSEASSEYFNSINIDEKVRNIIEILDKK